MLHPTPQYPPGMVHPSNNEATPRLRPSQPPSSSISPLDSPNPLPVELHEFVVIGGGTGCNSVVASFQGRKTTYVVPVSDDGGSSSEIQRVLGGPALGDIRSRLIRLIPPSPPNSPLDCIRRLLEYRLPGGSVSSREVKGEWQEIVEGSHKLWKGIPGDRKETIRAFLVHVAGAIMKKAQRGFNFKKASIGNLFLSGASLFLGSVPSAIFLFASLTSIPLHAVAVLPCINTSSSVTIAAELEDGRIIAGQSEISHPSPSTLFAASAASQEGNADVRPQSQGGLTVNTAGVGGYFPLTRATTPSFPDPPVLGAEEDDDLSRSLSPTSPDPNAGESTKPDATKNIEFSKDANEVPPLESRISRIFYLNAYGSEIWPRPNGLVLEALQNATCLVYAPGSLYTSILPCLELRPVGRLISRSHLPTTSISPPASSPSSSLFPPSLPRSSSIPSSSPPPLKYKILLLNSRHDRETPEYEAVDFVKALTEACARSCRRERDEEEDGEWRVEPRDVVTHVVYLPDSEVEVDEGALRNLGIVPVRCLPTSTGLFDDEVVREALGRIFAGQAV
ncbi:hypothetical protein JCM6882_001968 [Rhodosporidiobolus microsporus]